MFKAHGDAYVITDAERGIEFHVDHLRRDRYAGDLVGELRVCCGILGAKVIDGTLSAGRFNFSSLEMRSRHARLLNERAGTKGKVDWLQLLEDACLQVHDAERRGEPAILLPTVPRPSPDDEYDVDGLKVPRQHQTIWFGDGGTCKSYLALFYAATLARRGVNVGYVDWELDPSQHRDRLERLCGSDMPPIHYMRCERALVYEVDRLKRIRHEKQLGFLVYDSIAPACDGPPEAAEVAAAYHRARRQIGCGGIDIAHINKGPSEVSEQKPFGSAFWFNLARSTWNIKSTSDTRGVVSVAFYHRKANLGPLQPAVGFRLTFNADATSVTTIKVAEVPELADKLPLADRIKSLVASGPQQTYAELAEALGAPEDSVRKAIDRKPGTFARAVGPDGNYRIALLERRREG